MLLRRLLLILVFLLALAACGGGDDDGEPEAAPGGGGQTQAQPAAADPGTESAGPGKVLLSFVRAAERSDAEAMWGMLTEATKASIGPTLADFRGGAAQEFSEGVGSLAPTAKVILSRTLANDWAVAAVGGERTIEGKKEYFAYGVALLPEGGKLRIELGGVVVTGHKPDPLAELDEPRPRISANVGAGGDLEDLRMWLDGKPLAFSRGAEDSPFTATMQGKPAAPLAPGRHQVVVFASTADTATASAWAFSVKG